MNGREEKRGEKKRSRARARARAKRRKSDKNWQTGRPTVFSLLNSLALFLISALIVKRTGKATE